MSNPGTTVASVDTFAIGTPVAIFFLVAAITLFQFRDSLGTSFNLVLWLGFPIIGYLVCSSINLVFQYTSCKKLDAGKAFLGGLPSLGTILLALGVASISVCRIPIASVFTPLIVGKPVDVTRKNSTANTINSLKNSNSKECCVPKLILETIEAQYPIIAGISYGFYLMFAVLFGLIFGSGISSVC